MSTQKNEETTSDKPKVTVIPKSTSKEEPLTHEQLKTLKGIIDDAPNEPSTAETPPPKPAKLAVSPLYKSRTPFSEIAFTISIRKSDAEAAVFWDLGVNPLDGPQYILLYTNKPDTPIPPFVMQYLMPQ